MPFGGFHPVCWMEHMQKQTTGLLAASWLAEPDQTLGFQWTCPIWQCTKRRHVLTCWHCQHPVMSCWCFSFWYNSVPSGADSLVALMHRAQRRWPCNAIPRLVTQLQCVCYVEGDWRERNTLKCNQMSMKLTVKGWQSKRWIVLAPMPSKWTLSAK